MCNFRSDTEVMVCDAAIVQVRSQLQGQMPGAAQFTHHPGKATLVELIEEGDAALFLDLVQKGIATANAG